MADHVSSLGKGEKPGHATPPRGVFRSRFSPCSGAGSCRRVRGKIGAMRWRETSRWPRTERSADPAGGVGPYGLALSGNCQALYPRGSLPARSAGRTVMLSEAKTFAALTFSAGIRHPERSDLHASMPIRLWRIRFDPARGGCATGCHKGRSQDCHAPSVVPLACMLDAGRDPSLPSVTLVQPR